MSGTGGGTDMGTGGSDMAGGGTNMAGGAGGSMAGSGMADTGGEPLLLMLAGSMAMGVAGFMLRRKRC
jgi:LPXTG-motif cell wall-anchored protein